MPKEKLRSKIGITLIALVITIIVMLILVVATVTIALNGGLFQSAKKAAELYEKASNKELGYYDELIKEQEGITAKDLDKNNFGDYVDYGLDLNGNGDTTDDWRIFYVGKEENKDANERIYLIAADYVSEDTCNAIGTAVNEAHLKQKNNGEYSYSYYWSGTINYTCNDGHNKILNNDKRRCVFPEYFMIDSSYCSSHYYCSDHVGTDGTGGNWHSRNVSALQCIENWQALITESTKSQYAEYAIGGPTLELWIASWNSKHGKDVEENGETVYANGNNNSNDKSGYYVGNKYEANTTNCVLSSSEGYNDTLYFPHKSNEFIVTDENGEYKKRSWGYFLASPSALDGNYWLGVSYFGRVGDDKGSGDTLTIRPIILLKRGVKLIKETKDERTYYNLSI